MSYCIIWKDNIEIKDIKKYLEANITIPYNDVSPDLVIVIGGDGTILRAVHDYPKAVIFGVNTGHLGFYTNYTVNDFDELVSDINSGDYHIEALDLLTAEIYDNHNKIKVYALNEVTVITPPRTLKLDVFIDDEYFERFRGTGICVSTPTGSTGYNRSLGGSIIDTKINALQLTEIAGINSNVYRTLASPFVLAHDRVITLSSIEPTELYVVYDNKSYKTENLEKVVIYYEDNAARLAYHKHNCYINRLKRSFLNEKE